MSHRTNFSILCAFIALILHGLRGEEYGGYCNWNGLDLSHYGQNELSLNGSNVYYQYFYNPCNKSFYSSEEEKYYAIMRRDIDDPSNVRYLASKVSTRANVDSNFPIKTYKFTYEEQTALCPNGSQVTYVYWQCNNSITNYPYYYDIISCGSLVECVDTIFIQSPLVCDKDDQPPIENYNCSFKSNYTDIVLDLNTNSIYGGSDWKYRPCINKLLDTTTDCSISGKCSWAMISYTNIYKETSTVYSTWNILTDGIYGNHDPIYDPIKNVWNFTYYGYNVSSLTTNKICDVFTFKMMWGCNCKYKTVQTSIHTTGECERTWNLTRLALCINSIDQCNQTQNNTDCVYYHETSPYQYAKLSLSGLTGTIIVGVEPNGLDGFIYTPCNNNFVCDDNAEKVMAGRKNINEEQCIQYLGIFNGTSSFNVTYEPNKWEIDYSNGALCPSDETKNITFAITWICSTSVPWSVQRILFDECDYQVTIRSYYACS